MKLLSEEQLKAYVEYYGGDLDTITLPECKRGRGLSAVIFYCLHHPEQLPDWTFWRRTIRQAVGFLWIHLRESRATSLRIFHSAECRAYFQALLDGFIACYGFTEVARYNQQSWYMVNCQQMVNQLSLLISDVQLYMTVLPVEQTLAVNWKTMS